jgi:predicted dehydrogenase
LHGIPLRLGIVGCGFVTQDRHLPALGHVPEVEVVGLADVAPGLASEVAGRFGIARAHEDAAALLADPMVEAVAVCVPPAALAAVAVDALDAGRHVLIEKPLATTLEDADAVAETARRAGTVAGVGLNFRLHRFVERGRRLLRDGAIGRPLVLRAVFASPAPAGAWVGDSPLLDRGVHLFDLWRHLLDDEVEEVRALTGPAAAIATGRTRDGVLVEAAVTLGDGIANEVVVHGSAGTLALDLTRFDGFRLTGAEPPGSLRSRAGAARDSLADVRGSATAIRRGGDYRTTYEELWRRFAGSVRGGSEPTPSLADGRAALAIALRALDSAEVAVA